MERYSMAVEFDCYSSRTDMVSSSYGEWVKYEDAEDIEDGLNLALQKIEELEYKIKNLEGELEDCKINLEAWGDTQ